MASHLQIALYSTIIMITPAPVVAATILSYALVSCVLLHPIHKQMIWATSDQLGCAMRRCDGLRSDWGNPQYLSVCQYKPDGNLRGQKPYEYGRSCSKCPEGYFCLRNQCAKDIECKKAYPLMKLDDPSVRNVPECKVYRST
ncbi:unnamed protein product [Hydatigera taeniaeformis]|uniref:SCP domain-containing protein n=1 Tax=Hydatigena taeniaeformis TaxID=6205 RepID=A0A0R3WWN1_HYDTA|nr:unnamed protein product [Hydatigera taeniaeformis]